jgi:hypothetical protein
MTHRHRQHGLANQLKLVGQVIAGNLGTRLFSVAWAASIPTQTRRKPRLDCSPN